MRAGIALGSNVGNRLSHLTEGKKRLLKLHEGAEIALVSRVYETEPVDCAPGTASFLNAVLEIESSLDPLDLLDRTQRIESDLGRPAVREKNSPRMLDVDLLYIDEKKFDSERLILPHPHATERHFVMMPLCEIRPGLVWPGVTQTVSDLLASLKAIGPAPEALNSKW